MEIIRLIKRKDKVIVGWSGNYEFGGNIYNSKISWFRLNSAMTKDLIKEEVRRRVLSFRPTFYSFVKMEISFRYDQSGNNNHLKGVSSAD